METKHTPGPWEWRNFGNGNYLIAAHGMREIILASKRKGMSGSEITMNKDGILEAIDPKHPNAKLITAAPDLLLACQKLQEWQKKYPAGSVYPYNEARRIENELTEIVNEQFLAIKKATE